VIKSKPGEVIKPEQNTKEANPFVKTVANEGMPSHGNPFVKGNLFILFRVRFPEDNELTDEQISILKKVLPEADMDEEYDPDEVEEVNLDHSDIKLFGKGGAGNAGGDAYDSDDEDGGARGVQCQQS